MKTRRGFRLACAIVALLPTGGVWAADAARWDVAQSNGPYKEVRISTREGTWMSVDVSPDGRSIVFDLLGDIYLLPAEGGRARLLRGGPAIEKQPRFSPDGTRIAFISDADGSDNLWVMSVDGENAVQITRETADLLTEPAWHPDGERIAVRKNHSTQMTYLVGELWMYDLRGGAGVQLVKETKDASLPRFSPDGRYLYYSQDISPPTVVYRNPLEDDLIVRRLDLHTGEKTDLIRGYGGALSPQVSPDGRRIAFVRRVRERTVLFIYDLADGSQRPVYADLTSDSQVNPTGHGLYPLFAWFPDNRSVAIWSRGQILRIDTQTGTARPIAFLAEADHRITQRLQFTPDIDAPRFTVRVIRHPAVSNDGTVVFGALGRLWVRRGDAAPRRLTNSTDFEFEPAFSADGRRLVFVSWSDLHGSAVKILTLKDGRTREVFRTPALVRTPSFSPDGRQIVFRVSGGETYVGGHGAREGIYRLDLRTGESRFVLADGRHPVFAADGQRIYFNRKGKGGPQAGVSLWSANLDGLDEREHVTTRAARVVIPSPDGKWLAIEELGQVYLTPFVPAGSAWLAAPNGGGFPGRLLAAGLGRDLHWSPDSRTIHWLNGGEHFSAPVAAVFPHAGAPQDWVPRERGTALGLEAETDRPDGRIALVGARLITMRGDEVIEKGTVVVAGNRIEVIGPSDEIQVPPDAQVIDVGGKTIMPGIFDMHAHVHHEFGELAPQQYPPYFASLAFGVTTLFDPSAESVSSLARAEQIRAGVAVGPRVFSTGSPILGLSGAHPYAPVNGLDDARRHVAQRAGLGAVAVKSYMQMRRSQRQQLIVAAREQGVMLMPEAGLNFYNVLSMLLDGHTTIEHGIPLDEVYDDVIQLARHSGAAHTPTLLVAAGKVWGEYMWYERERVWEDPRVARYVPDALDLFGGGYKPTYVRSMWTPRATEEIYGAELLAVARMHRRLAERGVPVTVGSHGQIFGIGAHWEMWTLHEGGMSAHEVLRAATIHGAQSLGLAGQLGSLEAGKLADLIVLDGNPLEDIRATARVRLTMANGRLFDTGTMNEIAPRRRERMPFYWERERREDIPWDPTMIGPER